MDSEAGADQGGGMNGGAVGVPPPPPIADPRPELHAAIEAALQAGAAVMGVYSQDFETRTKKSDGSPVTEADLRSDRVIRSVLEGSGHAVLSEEAWEEDGTAEVAKKGGVGGGGGPLCLWIVDPLDGTADFVGRTGEFTVMIALAEGDVPVLGVIYWPVEDVLYVAQRGGGAFRRMGGGSWERIRVSGRTDLGGCRAVGSRNHLSDGEKRLIEAIGPKEFAGVGSSLKVARISSGEAELYVTTTDQMKGWDTCASCCIITEAGGRMTDSLGGELAYGGAGGAGGVVHPNGIVASNGGPVHEAVVEHVRRLSD